MHGWKDAIMDTALSFTEVVVSLIKALSIIGGVVGANLSDIGFGALALTFMFGGSGITIYNITPADILTISISAGTSAIQIGLWGVLARKGIGIKQLWNFKRLPVDIQSFLVSAILVWALDTTLDISPLSILIKGSLYEGGSWFVIVKLVVYSLVFLLCGFAEPLTANMRQMLETGNKPVSYNNNNNHNNNQRPSDRNRNNNDNNKKSQNDFRRQNQPNGNGAGNVASYLASKNKNANAHSKGEPTYHSPTYIGRDIVEKVSSDEEDVEEYMEMLNKMKRGNK
jgi:hypothetical protein